MIDPGSITAVTYGLAFATGLLSFLSPCVLPLVPAYVAYLAGAAGGSGDRGARFAHALAFVLGFGVLFVALGSAVGLLGWARARWLGQPGPGAGSTVGSTYLLTLSLARVGAVLIVVLAARIARGAATSAPRGRWLLAATGLAAGTAALALVGHAAAWPRIAPLAILDGLTLGLALLAGAWPRQRLVALGVGVAALNALALAVHPGMLGQPADWLAAGLQASAIVLIVGLLGGSPLLDATWRPGIEARAGGGYAASAMAGAVFCAGWTPCVGPNLVAITAVAGAAGTVGHGAGLLAVYAVGLGLPFLAVGGAWGASGGLGRRFGRLFPALGALNAALLCAVAALILTGRLQALASLPTFLDAEALLEGWLP